MRQPRFALLAALALSLLAPRAHAALILSELCDAGSHWETDRFIEIYNTGPGDMDLAGWKLVAIGNNSDVTTWTLSGTIAAGQAKVAGGTTTVTGFTVHFPSAVWTSTGYMTWNGGNAGDGAKLVDPNNVITDRFLISTAFFNDKTMVRLPSVTTPNPNSPTSEWTVTAVTLATDATPGTHNGSTPPPAGIRVANLVVDPAAPAASVPVNVQSSAVDPAGAITTVTASWGTTSGSQPNSIAMSLVSDSTWRTSSAIPGQAAGITIWYRVNATGPSGNAQTSLQSYAIPADAGAPTVLSVGQTSETTLLVYFSEPVQEASAETPSSYTVGAITATGAERDPAQPSQVTVTIPGIAPGARTLTVNGVQDLGGATANGATSNFTWIDVAIPAGYYSSAVGLSGSALRVALHNRIKGHATQSYSSLLTHFQITDRKPNGKVWDMYSDVPGGIPPYEYPFGDNDQGGSEGLGYNREHSFPRSWFNDASPMDSDLGHIFPTDQYVNNRRGSWPFAEVGSTTWISQNGSRLGTSVSPGYSDEAFEPIDAYKGDLARGHFYMATRYFGQDASWPGSPATDGAELYPWAVEQYQAWHTADPPSWKERLRNGAMYLIQGNRNPFIDHPEFLAAIYDSNSVVGVEDRAAATIALRAPSPNPFVARTTLGFTLPRDARVTLRVFDVGGRAVRTLASDRPFAAGRHALAFDGRDDAGARLAAGLYFVRLETPAAAAATRRIVFTP